MVLLKTKGSPVACVMPVPVLSVLLPEPSLVKGIAVQCIRDLGVEVSSCPHLSLVLLDLLPEHLLHVHFPLSPQSPDASHRCQSL